MKKARKGFNLCVIVYCIVLIICCMDHTVTLQAQIEKSCDLDISKDTWNDIDKMVRNIMKKAKIPGMSIALTQDGNTVYQNYGYSNKEERKNVTEDTYFEIGSMSKAFTGLAVLKLIREGKISKDDLVSKYLPWFHVTYHGTYNNEKIHGNVELKLSNLIYHTSGIPFQTIGDIPEDDTEKALERTVKGVCGTKLDYYPGTKYQYATLNYDILGLIIEKVSGESYEEYIQKNILDELDLKHTYLYKEDAKRNGDFAEGYKYNFFQARRYDAPCYRGNKPAGYIISNAKDMSRWMQIQMGTVNLSDEWKELIKESHQPDFSVNSNEYNLFYAFGWSVKADESDIEHAGSNPTYSSQIVMRPNNKMGVCILSNIDSNAAQYLTYNIINLIQGQPVYHYTKDSYKTVDTVFSLLLLVSIILGILLIVQFIKLIKERKQGKRQRKTDSNVRVGSIWVMFPLLVLAAICMYKLPSILFLKLSWKAVNVWCSTSIMKASILVVSVFLLFMCYVLVDFRFPKKKINYVTLVPLSIFNGIASAMIIFVINESMNRNLTYSKELLLYFIFALVYFVYTIKLLQGKLIVITNEIAYQKRVMLIEGVLQTSFENIEKIGKDRIFTGLNNDCAAIAELPRVIIRVASDSLTLIFCLAYLSSLSGIALLFSLGIIAFAAALSIVTSKLSVKYWKKNRLVQDEFFGQMSDMVLGFKELTLNKLRRFAFYKQITHTAKKTADLNEKASLKFLDFHLYNTIMYNLIFGVVVFIFPIMILNYDVNLLRENLLVVFYMVTPFNSVINSIQELTQMSVNINRINEVSAELRSQVYQKIEANSEPKADRNNKYTITLENIEYTYKTRNEEQSVDSEFKLGPLNLEFSSDEITFITGGNGSGKSTIGKIISGLYIAEEGCIKVNGQEVKEQYLNQLFSSVYSDFHLFHELLGIEYEEQVLDEYLQLMEIEEKIKVDEGKISTLSLSTGQSKRLAYVVSMLEHKPMVILDEWAAEQDPRFRNYFYETLLPRLKKSGTGVILITHDDRYFNTADKVVRMERGKVQQVLKNSNQEK